MGIFDKEKTDEKKAKDKQVVTDAEEKREALAEIIEIKRYTDTGEIVVLARQNITKKAQAEYIVSETDKNYLVEKIANVTTIRFIDLFTQKKKNNKLWVPGGK